MYRLKNFVRSVCFIKLPRAVLHFPVFHPHFSQCRSLELMRGWKFYFGERGLLCISTLRKKLSHNNSTLAVRVHTGLCYSIESQQFPAFSGATLEGGVIELCTMKRLQGWSRFGSTHFSVSCKENN